MLIEQNNYQTLPRLFNYIEVAEILGLQPQTLRQWVSGKRIPFIKLGKSVRFSPEMIEKIIKDGVK